MKWWYGEDDVGDGDGDGDDEEEEGDYIWDDDDVSVAIWIFGANWKESSSLRDWDR